jgi:hypothetical protein
VGVLEGSPCALAVVLEADAVLDTRVIRRQTGALPEDAQKQGDLLGRLQGETGVVARRLDEDLVPTDTGYQSVDSLGSADRLPLVREGRVFVPDDSRLPRPLLRKPVDLELGLLVTRTKRTLSGVLGPFARELPRPGRKVVRPLCTVVRNDHPLPCSCVLT